MENSALEKTDGHDAAAGPGLIGVLTARQRVMRLFDDDTTFVEWGPEAGTGDPSDLFSGDSVIAALGWVNGKSAVVICYDASVGEGRQGIVAHKKTLKALDVAGQLKAPVFVLAQGGELRTDQFPLYEEGHDQIVDIARLSGRVPLIGVAFGEVYGTRALLLSTCDVLIATPSAVIDLSDPAVTLPEVENLSLTQERSGAVDLVAPGDAEALRAARLYTKLISDPLVEFDDPDDPAIAEQLRAIVPGNPRRAFDAERLVALLADPGSALVLRRKFGPSIVTALGRIGGRAVGFLANNSMHGAGAIDSPASDKMTRFIRTCDAFGLPLVYLTDTPGLLAGPKGERSAMARHSTRPFFALHTLRVPVYSVIVRRAFGQGPTVMAVHEHGGTHYPVLRLSWPTAQFGAMGLGGAAAITSASSSSRQGGETRSQDEIERSLVAHGSAGSRALRFETDAVVDPGETRALLRAAVAHAPVYDVREPRWAIDAW